jgi:hypothetical protein
MLCYTTLSYATLCYAMLHYATLCYTTLRYATLPYAMLHYATLCYTTLCYATLRYATLRDAMLLYVLNATIATLHYATPLAWCVFAGRRYIIPAYYNDNFFWNIAKSDQVGAAPSRVQMIAVGCQRAFAARTADTWFERHLVAYIFCQPHVTKNPHWNPTLLYRHLT